MQRNSEGGHQEAVNTVNQTVQVLGQWTPLLRHKKKKKLIETWLTR